jgi:hypothetical protein
VSCSPALARRRRLRNPDLIAAEARKRQQEGTDPHLDADLATARRQCREYERQQQRLVQRYASAGDDSHFPWEVVEREVQRLDAAQRRWQDTIDEIEGRIAVRARSRAHMGALVAYCARVASKLDAFDFPARCLALDALNVTVTATGKSTDDWDLDGEIPLHVEAAAEGDAAELIR